MGPLLWEGSLGPLIVPSYVQGMTHSLKFLDTATLLLDFTSDRMFDFRLLV